MCCLRYGSLTFSKIQETRTQTPTWNSTLLNYLERYVYSRSYACVQNKSEKKASLQWAEFVSIIKTLLWQPRHRGNRWCNRKSNTVFNIHNASSGIISRRKREIMYKTWIMRHFILPLSVVCRFSTDNRVSIYRQTFLYKNFNNLFLNCVLNTKRKYSGYVQMRVVREYMKGLKPFIVWNRSNHGQNRLKDPHVGICASIPRNSNKTKPVVS